MTSGKLCVSSFTHCLSVHSGHFLFFHTKKQYLLFQDDSLSLGVHIEDQFSTAHQTGLPDRSSLNTPASTRWCCLSSWRQLLCTSKTVDVNRCCWFLLWEGVCGCNINEVLIVELAVFSEEVHVSCDLWGSSSLHSQREVRGECGLITGVVQHGASLHLSVQPDVRHTMLPKLNRYLNDFQQWSERIYCIWSLHSWVKAAEPQPSFQREDIQMKKGNCSLIKK